MSSLNDILPEGAANILNPLRTKDEPNVSLMTIMKCDEHPKQDEFHSSY